MLSAGRLQVSVDGCNRYAEVLERVRQAVEQAIDAGADGRLLACRIELPAAQTSTINCWYRPNIFSPRRAAALGFGEAVAWIERVIVATETRSIRRYSPDAGTQWGNFFHAGGGLH